MPPREIDLLAEQLRFARMYTQHLRDATPASDWFRLPPGAVSHVATGRTPCAARAGPV